MEFFLKNKIVIIRTVGFLMLLVGFSVHFWATPKEGLSKNEIAAANIARMESVVSRGSGQSLKSQKKDNTKFLETLKNTQKKQIQYLTIISMILGVGFLGYSFIPKRD